ncbi:MAG: hypothetical protein WD850_01470 [Candidatus Spechtbacterales bacterium]
MLWIIPAVAAYALFGLSAVADRYLLAGPLPHPRAYAFYAGITGLLASVLIPLSLFSGELFGITFPLFTFSIPQGLNLALPLAAGGAGIVALYFLYRGLLQGSVASVIPMIGAASPVATLLLGVLVAGERIDITPKLAAAFGLLVVGTVLLAFTSHPGRFEFSSRDVRNALFAALFFGANYTLIKLTFLQEGFFNGFIWVSYGSFLMAASFLLVPGTRAIVFQKNPLVQRRVLWAFLVGKGSGTLGAFLQNVAIYLAQFVQVALINALAGLQYFFILVFAGILALRNPRLLKEELSISSVSLRFAGAGVISLGIALLFL